MNQGNYVKWLVNIDELNENIRYIRTVKAGGSSSSFEIPTPGFRPEAGMTTVPGYMGWESSPNSSIWDPGEVGMKSGRHYAGESRIKAILKRFIDAGFVLKGREPSLGEERKVDFRSVSQFLILPSYTEDCVQKSLRSARLWIGSSCSW